MNATATLPSISKWALIVRFGLNAKKQRETHTFDMCSSESRGGQEISFQAIVVDKAGWRGGDIGGRACLGGPGEFNQSE